MITITLSVFWLFVIIATIFGLLYSLGRNDIFIYSFTKNKQTYEGELKSSKEGPFFWKLEQHLHIFLGVFFGWMLLWYLLDVRLSLFTGEINQVEPNLFDIGIFLLAIIGVNGRLPSIAHAIGDFMKSGTK